MGVRGELKDWEIFNKPERGTSCRFLSFPYIPGTVMENYCKNT